MAYNISSRTKKVAKEIGVSVKPSTRKNKKLDVYKNGKKVCSIGDTRYNDYHTYKAKERSGKVEKGTSEKRRKAYLSRHGAYRKNTCGYFAEMLLWT